MARPDLLTNEEIERQLNEIPLWNRSNNILIREAVAANFVSIIGIVNAIAVIAEQINHHPDLLIYGWNKLRISTTTHDRGGLTELDFVLAKKIDELNLF